MRIISGTLAGRRIPFNNKLFGNARVTTDFVKEALFGSLGPDLTSLRMLDIFTGSGQIGLEAVSRGTTAWMNDRDRKRVAFIRGLIDEWDLRDQITLTGFDWEQLLAHLGESGDRFDLIYIDPPYDAVTLDGILVAKASLQDVARRGLLSDNGRLFVQHDKRTDLPPSAEDLVLKRSRRYGDSHLSRYEPSSDQG